MELYERIAFLCKKNNIAITRLESELGFGRGSIGKMKGGKTTSVDRLQKIADFFGVSINYLLSENPDTADAPVQKNEQAGYYTNPETAKKAQELFDDPKYRVLFDAAEGSDPEDLQMAADLLLRLKQTRRD